jgi:uncharacterized protein (TIGR04255 family)
LPSRTLPDYHRPPVVEVAISAFFHPIPKLTTVRIGEFWCANREEYPKTEDYPPIMESVSLDLISVPPLRRVFMITADERYVLQLQQDAFIHNWRKIKDEDAYPHFDAAQKKFKEKFAQFRQFVEKNDLGQANGTRFEVTYVNHLAGGNISEAMSQYVDILRLQPATERQLLPPPRALNADLWFDLPGEQGTLRVSFKQGSRTSDKKEVMQVELTARGVAKSDYSNMDSWLEMAHEWIVRGFTEITTTDAHKKWERTL